MNSSGHFLMVITNGANAGGAGAKPLLGSANTVWYYGLVRLGIVSGLGS